MRLLIDHFAQKKLCWLWPVGAGSLRCIRQIRVAPTFVLKYNIRTRSLADPGAIEDVLAVEDDVVPFDRADVLGAGLRQGLPW